MPTSSTATAWRRPDEHRPRLRARTIGARETLRRGFRASPELAEGIGWTLVLAVIASVGQIVVPVAVQQTLDRGINGPDGPDVAFTVLLALGALVVLVAGGLSLLPDDRRLFTSSERGLATLRIKAFRHVHDLPLLTQNTERRGALVSRVTSDVDQVSQFLVFGGLLLVVSAGQVLVATVVMLIYSWQLTIVVWLCFAPLFLSIRYFQRKLSDAYTTVRGQVAVMLSAISEPVVGAAVVKSYAVEARTQARIDDAIEEYKAASTRAQQFTVVSFSLGGISAGLANASALIVGIWLGFAGEMTAGKVLAFAFLVTLFVGPVQMGTQILTDAQNAIVSWRRVIGILETPADLVDPGRTAGRCPVAPRRALRGRRLRLPGRSAGAARHRPLPGRRPSGRGRRRDRLRQVHDRQAADPADGPVEGAVLLDGVDVRQITQDVAAPQRGAGPAGGLPLQRHHRGQRPLRPTRRHRRRDRRRGRRARPRRLARRPSGRSRDPGRPARRVALGRRAAAGRAAARPARRPRPAGPRRGHQLPSTRRSRCGSAAPSSG